MQIQSVTFGNSVLFGMVSIHADREGFTVVTEYLVVPNPNVFRLLGDSETFTEVESLQEARDLMYQNQAIGERNAEAAMSRSLEVAAKAAEPVFAAKVARENLLIQEIKGCMTKEMVKETDDQKVIRYSYRHLVLVFTYLEIDIYVDQLLYGEVINSQVYGFEDYWPAPEDLFAQLISE